MPITPEYFEAADLEKIECTVELLSLERRVGNGLWAWNCRIKGSVDLEDGRSIVLDRTVAMQCKQKGRIKRKAKNSSKRSSRMAT